VRRSGTRNEQGKGLETRICHAEQWPTPTSRYLDFTATSTKEEELEALEMEMREELGILDDNESMMYI
jgi:hypothetical protein